MREWITIQTMRAGEVGGLERIQSAYAEPGGMIERIRGCFMRDAEGEFARAGYEQTARVCDGEVIRYRYERRVGRA